MGIKEGALALADELEAFEDGDCEECIAYGQPECKGHLSCAEIIARYSARKVREAVERDAEDVTTVSAYDLLGDDDREALAWVRDHGGIEAVKASIHQGAMEHGYLLKVAEILGTSIYDGTGNADALLDKLEKRLMPEGMEWPKVDGKPVDFKTAYGPSLGVLEAVSIYNTGACQVMSHDGIVKNATEIHIVKPKVLDADGVEIREGDVLYSVETGDYVTVGSIEPGNPWFATTDGALQHCAKFTHRAPVLAADGEPLEVGQTVYGTRDQTPVEVIATHSHEYDGIRTVKCKDANGCLFYCPEDLTHAKPEQPDTWGRLFADACKGTCDYYGRKGCIACPALNEESCMDAMLTDLVHRCRALAERGE